CLKLFTRHFPFTLENLPMVEIGVLELSATIELRRSCNHYVTQIMVFEYAPARPDSDNQLRLRLFNDLLEQVFHRQRRNSRSDPIKYAILIQVQFRFETQYRRLPDIRETPTAETMSLE